MAKSTGKARRGAPAPRANAFQMRKPNGAARDGDTEVHVYGEGFRCDTDTRGHASPRGRSPLEIVLDASEGFIPLWSKDVTLRWRFRASTLRYFQNPSAARIEIRRLIGDALLAWGEAAPVKFKEHDDLYDFEVVMRKTDDCDGSGCVLASAFFPDAGRHKLVLYPKLFDQTRQEQVDTIVHELGHVFGLRHFFANVSETAWPSQIFGVHKPFTIMNYGSKSVLTQDDKADLRRLYQLVWRGELTRINGTPIKLMKPFHGFDAPPENVVAVGAGAVGQIQVR